MVKMRRIQGSDVLGLALCGASYVGAFCWILGAGTGRRPIPNMVAWTGQEGWMAVSRDTGQCHWNHLAVRFRSFMENSSSTTTYPPALTMVERLPRDVGQRQTGGHTP